MFLFFEVPCRDGAIPGGITPNGRYIKAESFDSNGIYLCGGRGSRHDEKRLPLRSGILPCHDFSMATDPIPRKAFIPTALLPMKSSVSSFISPCGAG